MTAKSQTDNTPPNQNNELEDELGEILKPLSDGGYHNNSDDKTRSTCYDCKRIDQATAKLTKLISKREIEARIKEAEYYLSIANSTNNIQPNWVAKITFQKRLTELQEEKNNG